MNRTAKKTAKKLPTKQSPLKTVKKSLTTRSKPLAKLTHKSPLRKLTTRQFSTATTTSANDEEPDILAAAVIKMAPKDLITGAQNGDLLLLKECLAQEDPKLDINLMSGYKQTPLILAIKQRHVKSVLLLAKNGADINLPDGQQFMSPFMHVVKKNSVSLFNHFMALGPNTHTVTRDNQSPMTIAGKAGTQIAILNELLDMGFAIDHRDKYGRTPLMYAVRSAHIYVVQWWLDQGANPLTKDKNGRCAVDYAPQNHDGDVARLVRTRANEMRQIHRLEQKDENAAVSEALMRLKAQAREQSKPKQTQLTTQ